MDPQETLRRILAATTPEEAIEFCEYLRDWLKAGGFAPKVEPGTYWPGTNTPFAILYPVFDDSLYRFVEYDVFGNKIAVFELFEEKTGT